MNNDLEQYAENSFTDLELEGMAHGNNPADNAYRELLAFRRAAKQAKPVAWITWHQGFRAPDDCEDYLRAYPQTTEEKSCDGSDAIPVYTTPQPTHAEQVIPDGWKLVPIEPTQEMVDACFEATSAGGIQKGYRAMLAAAPKPESE